jgi:hypothetical protein
MTPHQKAVEVLKRHKREWAVGEFQSRELVDEITTVLQAQSNEDEERHRKTWPDPYKVSEEYEQMKRDAAESASLCVRVAQLEEALGKQPCLCPPLIECPRCHGPVVEGRDQYEGSWICGKCVAEVQLPKDPDRPCARCAALSAPPGEWLERVKREAKAEVYAAIEKRIVLNAQSFGQMVFTVDDLVALRQGGK